MALSILQRDLIQTLLLIPSHKQSDGPQVKAEHKLCGLGMTIIQLKKLFSCITLLGLTFLMSVTVHFPTRQEKTNTLFRRPKLGFAFTCSGAHH